MSQTLVIKPLQDGPRRKPFEDFAGVFRVHNIRHVRIQWVDLNNQVRARVLSVSYFRKLLDSERPGITIAKMVLAAVVIDIVPGFCHVGEFVYVIDLSSFRLCSYAPGHAVFFGFFQEPVATPRPNELSYEVPLCPRTLLSRLTRYASKELGIQFSVGIETEFILLKSTNPIVAVNEYQYGTTFATATGTVEARVMDEIAEALEADGIELEFYHREAAPGQYEIVTGPLPPLEAADALVHTRETIYNIATKHGLKATFVPRLNLDNCGSGAHIHVSVHGNKSGTSGSELLSPLESAFLAGLMHHLPSVMAFTLPLTASYARMVDGIMASGTWVSWGVEDREVAVRLTKPHSPSSRHFEIRPVDGTSSPYLAIAGILACGILGVRDDLPLTVRTCEGLRSVGELTEAEKAALGITRRLPLNAAEARKYLAADDALKSLLGPELVDHFVPLNELLAKMLDRREGESEEQALTRLIENY